MHDWTLLRIVLDWRTKIATFDFKDTSSVVRTLIAEGVRELRIPCTNPWGPSVSVNEVLPVEISPDGGQNLKIEMQSGDVIQVVTSHIAWPIVDRLT